MIHQPPRRTGLGSVNAYRCWTNHNACSPPTHRLLDFVPLISDSHFALHRSRRPWKCCPILLLTLPQTRARSPLGQLDSYGGRPLVSTSGVAAFVVRPSSYRINSNSNRTRISGNPVSRTGPRRGLTMSMCFTLLALLYLVAFALNSIERRVSPTPQVFFPKTARRRAGKKYPNDCSLESIASGPSHSGENVCSTTMKFSCRANHSLKHFSFVYVAEC
jgi:hypothetical protein